MDKVIVNEEQCKLIADRLSNLSFRPEHYQREFLTFQVDKETKLRVFFFPVAICHQTHILGSKSLNLKGWEYFEYIYMNLGLNHSKLLEPSYVASLKVEELVDHLRETFSENGICSLDRLEERARMLIDCCKILEKDYEGKVSNLLDSTKGFLINNGEGLYERLKKFEAYSDPLQKKSTVFLKFLLDANIYQLKDPENIIPIMDYHMQRVLLRSGCIEVLDPLLRNALMNKEKLEDDREIREAAVEAIKIISKSTGDEITGVHDFFWPIGRSCCKEKTKCTDGSCNKDPCSFEKFVNISEHKDCILAGICKGSRDPEYRKFWQPIVDTHYY